MPRNPNAPSARDCCLVRHPIRSTALTRCRQLSGRQQRLDAIGTLLLEAADSDDPDREAIIAEAVRLAEGTAEQYRYADHPTWRPPRPTTPPQMNRLAGQIGQVWAPWLLSKAFIAEFA